MSAPRDTVVVVRAGEHVFAVITSFARVPVPGEHVMLVLTDAQRAQLGAEFGIGVSRRCVPAVVRDTVMRQRDQWRTNFHLLPALTGGIEGHIADLFAEAITTRAWNAKIGRWGSGGE